MELMRSCGVLLHITSLPGKFGTGTLGDEAYEFIDLLADNGVTYWQILPTGPVSDSMCYSPYSSLSAFAGNELFISTDSIRKNKWFRDEMYSPVVEQTSFADFIKAGEYTVSFLKTSETNFRKHSTPAEKEMFDLFIHEHGEIWLNDYALYRALAEKYHTFSWLEWDRKLALRDKDALSSAVEELENEINFIKFAQFIFFSQWNDMSEYAGKKNIKIIGDIPIYMSMDSADSWVAQSIIEIDYDKMKPAFIAGVPPDYFCETGQLWGNPVYRWHKDKEAEKRELNEETYQWWLKRVKHILTLTDSVRIDHFRGFESFWSVEYGEETAVDGTWVDGPGKILFDRLLADLGDLPIIAEDLGVITPAVKKLRDDLGLPGMKILLFAFDQNNKNEYLTHNITDKHCIVYTGTHDNDTANGWFYNDSFPEDDRRYILEYLGMNDWSNFHIRIIREAMATLADLIIIPAQDILGYGSEFRMNTPGTTENNWKWKLKTDELNSENMGRIKRMAHMFSRVPEEE
jgi:4-alpha-glucanotransferase